MRPFTALILAIIKDKYFKGWKFRKGFGTDDFTAARLPSIHISLDTAMPNTYENAELATFEESYTLYFNFNATAYNAEEIPVRAAKCISGATFENFLGDQRYFIVDSWDYTRDDAKIGLTMQVKTQGI